MKILHKLYRCRDYVTLSDFLVLGHPPSIDSFLYVHVTRLEDDYCPGV